MTERIETRTGTESGRVFDVAIVGGGLAESGSADAYGHRHTDANAHVDAKPAVVLARFTLKRSSSAATFWRNPFAQDSFCRGPRHEPVPIIAFECFRDPTVGTCKTQREWPVGLNPVHLS